MLKIIKIIFFSSIFFLNLNLIGDEFKTIVQAKDEDISTLLQKALDQSILKVLGSQTLISINKV